MAFLLKDTIHRSLVDTVYNEFLSRRSNYYYFIGNILEWDNPQNPDAPEVTQAYEHYTRNGIFGVKKINLRDVSYVVPRIDWTTGTVYDQFDGEYSSTNTAPSGATSLKTANFYVLTSTYGVYKCIFNNNGAESTEEPSGQDITMITTSDGYVWKYLYTIPLSSQNRFLTADYMPVQRAVTNAYYSKGEVSSIVIDSKGSGYLGNAEVTLAVQGTFLGGTGNSIANLTPVLNSAGEFIDIIIEDPGANYKTASIVITDNLGAGTSHYNNISNVRIFNPGTGYNAAVIANTTVAITTTGTQPSSNAFANLIFSSNSLVDVVLTNKGYGYTTPIRNNTSITIATTGAIQPTSNATANLFFSTSAILTPVLVDGALHSVLIEDEGIGYSANTQTTISLNGDGTGAVLSPFVNPNGEIEDIIIEHRGNGYTYLNISVASTTGTGANAYANLSTDDLDTLQTVVELSAVPGALHAFRVEDGGTGYSQANVSVVGDGESFTGEVVLADNAVSYITVTTPGLGYSYANVTITGDGANANVTAILSPYGGHGSDPVRELNADTLMFTSTINNEKNQGIVVTNDYRQFGIIKDIKQYGSGQMYASSLNGGLSYTGVTGSACYLLTMDTVSGLAADTVLQHTMGASTRDMEIVHVEAATNQILLAYKDTHDLAVGDELLDPTSNLTYTISVIDAEPEINKFSGDLLYIDNRTAASYSAQQLVTLRTVIKL
ncbi:hypothetical protein UFOVP242_126 [uncultured Caudovirales phage]|uniref:Baseplate wedge subunit n=1 Tax=uncultured Caudovirales phage TaxID=2100421 RepID=A0A6J7WV88_9CAUD|nr:hypothetical protein UFOVP242_126 [uncultured Caudovirales phage]